MTTLSESVSNAVNNLSTDDLRDLAGVIIESAIKGDQLSLQFVLECEIDAIKQAKISRFAADLSALLSETNERFLTNFDQQDNQVTHQET